MDDAQRSTRGARKCIVLFRLSDNSCLDTVILFSYQKRPCFHCRLRSEINPKCVHSSDMQCGQPPCVYVTGVPAEERESLKHPLSPAVIDPWSGQSGVRGVNFATDLKYRWSPCVTGDCFQDTESRDVSERGVRRGAITMGTKGVRQSEGRSRRKIVERLGESCSTFTPFYAGGKVRYQNRSRERLHSGDSSNPQVA